MNAGPGELVVVDGGDLEAGVAHELLDRAVEVTSAGDASLHTVESVLPARHAGVGAETVLEEVERASGSQHPMDLAHGTAGVGDRAQRERAQRGVDRRVVERQLLAVEPDVTRIAAGDAGDALGRELARHERRVDRVDGRDLGWVDRHVEPGAEADLHDVAVETVGGAARDGP